jgi:hypothetical protein
MNSPRPSTRINGRFLGQGAQRNLPVFLKQRVRGYELLTSLQVVSVHASIIAGPHKSASQEGS